MHRLTLFPQTDSPVTIITLPALPDVVNLRSLKENTLLVTEEEWERVDRAIAQIEEDKQQSKQTSPRGEKTIVYSKKDLAEAYSKCQKKMSSDAAVPPIRHVVRTNEAQECFEYSVVALTQFDTEKKQWRDYHFAIYSTSLDRGAFGKIEVAQARSSQQEHGQPVWWVLKKQLIGLGGHLTTLTEATTEQEIAISVGSSPRAKTRMRRSKSKLGEPPQVAYLMQFAPGCSIEKFLKREYAWHFETFSYSPLISPLVRLEVIVRMIKEVMKLHEQNYVHGDIKAANFVVDWVSKSVKLVDYGATHQLNEDNQFYTDKLIGTSIHLSPQLREQLKAQLNGGQPIFCLNKATDAYALGIAIADFLHLLETVDSEVRHDVCLWGDKNFVAYNDRACGVDGYHDLFLFNETLDKTTLAAMLEVVHHLVDDNELTRWTVAEALEKVAALKKAYIESNQLAESQPESQPQIRVGMLDVAAYLKLTECEREQQQHDLLAQYEEIVLFEVSDQVRSLNEYFYALRALSQFQMTEDIDGNYALKRRGLIVHDKVFIGTDLLAIHAKIKNYVEGLSLPSRLVNSREFELNHADPSMGNAPQTLSDRERPSFARV